MSHKCLTIWKTNTPADRTTELVRGDEQDYETVNRAVARMYGDELAHMGQWLTPTTGMAATDYDPGTEALTLLDQITVRWND